MDFMNFMNGLKGDFLRQKLLQVGISTNDMQGVDFNNMNDLNKLARTALAEARVIAQNNQQTNELIARLSPTATPAWLVNSPYTSIYPPTTTAAASGS